MSITQPCAQPGVGRYLFQQKEIVQKIDLKEYVILIWLLPHINTAIMQTECHLQRISCCLILRGNSCSSHFPEKLNLQSSCSLFFEEIVAENTLFPIMLIRISRLYQKIFHNTFQVSPQNHVAFVSVKPLFFEDMHLISLFLQFLR